MAKFSWNFCRKIDIHILKIYKVKLKKNSEIFCLIFLYLVKAMMDLMNFRRKMDINKISS